MIQEVFRCRGRQQGARSLSVTRFFAFRERRFDHNSPMHRSPLRIALSSGLLAAPLIGADDDSVYIGTYAKGDDSRGIYRSRLDPEIGELDYADAKDEDGSPGCIRFLETK